MSFNSVAAAGQRFSEQSDMMGESFTYANIALVGVFNQVELDFRFDEFSTRKITALVCTTSKPQWAAAAILPANRGLVSYGGIDYPIQAISGLDSTGEPCFELTLFKAT